MGSGKTAVGKALAKLCQFEFIDSDHEIERRIEGEETTLVSGCITVMDGINDDSGDH